uniref:SP110 nuclear body protein n=1 Tax=Ailuropoda melanoleuca TaxID=9646 RepID=G1MDN2_AILME
LMDIFSWMFTMTRALEDTLLQQFIYQKLEIAYAIYKPFPFLEGLRDNFFITETMYRESMEACRNQVPIPRVVYNVLTHLEKNFSVSFLEMLFSRINLHEYPHLMTILKGFRRWSRAVPTLLEAPANPAEGCSLQTLLPLPPPQSHPPHAPSIMEPSTSTQHSAEIVGEPSSPSDPAVTLPRATQEESITPGKRKTLSNTYDVYPFFLGKKRKRSIWSTPKKRHQKKRLPKGKKREQEEVRGHRQLMLVGRTSPQHKSQEKLQGVDQAPQRKDDSPRKSNVMTRAQKAKAECAQTAGPEEISEDFSEMNEEKSPQEPPSTLPRILFTGNPNLNYSQITIPRAALPGHSIQEKLRVVDQAPERKDDSTGHSKIMTRAQKARIECVPTSELKEKKREKGVSSSSTRRCQKNIPRKQKPKDETMDFLSPELPVTCGEAKGILYKEKLKQGSSEKCIRNEEGVWFTPKEFEIEGKRTKTRKWKQTVLCRGKTLEELLKKGLLLCPPRISVKREVKSRSPWSCTFCRIKESLGRQQRHRESEVLQRQMQPEERVKCEFLLLKAYCHPQSSFFAETPRNIRDYGEPFKEAMWLDLIKERLTEKVYTVAWFVRDMHLIFHNHKTFYKVKGVSCFLCTSFPLFP